MDINTDALKEELELGINEVVGFLRLKRENLKDSDVDSYLSTLDKACGILKKTENMFIDASSGPTSKTKGDKKVGYSTQKYLNKTG